MPLSETEYFAALPLFDKSLAAELFSQMDAWIEFCEDGGLDRRWTQNTALYHGADPKKFDRYFDEQSFQIMGENGEILFAAFNDYRNLLQHILNMTVSTPPNMTAKAINDEPASLIAAQTFDGVFDFYMNTYQDGRLMAQSRMAVEHCLYADVGYTLVEWDKYLGRPIGQAPEPMNPPSEPQDPNQMPAPPKMVYEGDLYIKTRSVWDVFFDPGVEDDTEKDWVIIRDQVNKFEYAARFAEGEMKQKILRAQKTSSRVADWRRGFERPNRSQMIDIFKFYHKPNTALPQGRYAVFVDADTVCEDGPNPYDQLPIFNIKAMEGIGGVIGYGPGNVIAPVQMARNVLSTAFMTNFAMFGVQNIAVNAADDFDVSSLAGGMNVLKYTQTAPMPLQLTAQADGILQAYQMLGTAGETLSGINSVVRGDPDSSLKSGKALGIVQAAAVQFQSALAASYAQYLKNIGNFMLQLFRKFATTQRVTQIVGRNDVQQAANWDADTFGPIDRVSAELMDPAMRTLGYRTDLAEKLIQNGLVATAQEFLTVLTTGQLKPLYRAPLSDINLVHQENQDMMDGGEQLAPMMQALQQQLAANPPPMPPPGMPPPPDPMQQLIAKFVPPVLLMDNDDMHIAEHASILASPKTRRNSSVVAIALAHIEAHHQNKMKKAVQQGVEQLQVQGQIEAAKVQMFGPSQPQQTQAPQGQPAQHPQHNNHNKHNVRPNNSNNARFRSNARNDHT